MERRGGGRVDAAKKRFHLKAVGAQSLDTVAVLTTTATDATSTVTTLPMLRLEPVDTKCDRKY